MSDALVEVQLAAAGFDPVAVERIREILGQTLVPEPPERIVAGPVVLDPRTRRVELNGTRIELAQKEFELLRALAREPERVFTKEELLRTVWGYRSTARTRTLDSHASRLRRKFRAVDAELTIVVNLWGVGYRLFPGT